MVEEERGKGGVRGGRWGMRCLLYLLPYTPPPSSTDWLTRKTRTHTPFLKVRGME